MKPSLRVVLDTNILVSALLFSQGKTANLRLAWQAGQFQPLVSKATIAELIRVLAYPKFKLTPEEQAELLADYLPFCTTVRMPAQLPTIPQCRDSFDLPFLYLADASQADYLVTGDLDLLSLADTFACPIVSVDQFLAVLTAV
jgi:putative PIN family toxin of toxin-antitoxin system